MKKGKVSVQLMLVRLVDIVSLIHPSILIFISSGPEKSARECARLKTLST